MKINRQEDPPNVGKGKYYINPTFTKVDRNAQRKKKNKKENERVFKRRATSIKLAQAKGSRAAVTAMAQTSSQVVNENQLSHESSCAETSSLVSSCMSSSEDPNSPINSSPKKLLILFSTIIGIPIILNPKIDWNIVSSIKIIKTTKKLFNNKL